MSAPVFPIRNSSQESRLDVVSSAKGADWKVEIAKRLRKETTAKNPWIAGRLKMGHPNSVSNLVHGEKSLYFAFDPLVFLSAIKVLPMSPVEL